MKITTIFNTALAFLLTVGFAIPAMAQDAGQPDAAALAKVANKKPGYSPNAGRDFPTRPFFGDTHVHTATSFDAGAFGTTLGPRDAYRFARGEEVVSNSGQRVKMARPLDFLAVTDHSDNMGFFPDLMAGKQQILANPTGRKWYDMVKAGKGADVGIEAFFALFQGTYPKELMYNPGSRGFRRTWDDNIAAAERYNDPGRFTAFIGYEWSASVSGSNLHRNVVFRDGGDKARQVEPIVTNPPVGNPDPAFLWKWMETYEKKTGGSVLAIAHNGNLSNGMMFPMIETFGKQLDRDYVETRARWERLIEVTQTKGTGEAHPFLSPNDEFADFELWDKGNLDLSAAKSNQMLQYEYAREASGVRGTITSPRRSDTTTRAASPRSSATSGRRRSAGATSTATSSSATAAIRRARWSRSSRTRPSATPIRPSSGSGWRPTRRKPEAVSLPSLTTVT